MSALEVQTALRTALGHEPAYWAPGVARLGWSFSMQNGGKRLIINRALSEEAKLRYMKLLPKVFSGAGLRVEIIGNEALDGS